MNNRVNNLQVVPPFVQDVGAQLEAATSAHKAIHSIEVNIYQL